MKDVSHSLDPSRSDGKSINNEYWQMPGTGTAIFSLGAGRGHGQFRLENKLVCFFVCWKQLSIDQESKTPLKRAGLFTRRGIPYWEQCIHITTQRQQPFKPRNLSLLKAFWQFLSLDFYSLFETSENNHHPTSDRKPTLVDPSIELHAKN